MYVHLFLRTARLTLIGSCALWVGACAMPEGQRRAQYQLAREQVAVQARAWITAGADVTPAPANAPVAPMAPASTVPTLKAGHGGDPLAEVDPMLSHELSADDVLVLALKRSPALAAADANLEAALAQVDQGLAWPNPRLSLLRTSTSGGGQFSLDQTLSVNLLAVLQMPAKREAAAGRVAEIRQRYVQTVLQWLAQTRRAYFQAVAAEAAANAAGQVMEAAEAASELARRMEQAGNFNLSQRGREQQFHDDAVLAYESATRLRAQTRYALARLIGVPEAALHLPDQLPPLPAHMRALPEVSQQALERRYDVQQQKARIVSLARELEASRGLGRFNLLELGAARSVDGGRAAPEGQIDRSGFELAIELPLFDWGQVRNARAEAQVRAAWSGLAQTALDAEGEVRLAHAVYASDYRVVAHLRDQILPLRQDMAKQTLLRYNANLISVFELLSDTRIQIGTQQRYQQALMAFWLAQVDLDMSLLGARGETARVTDGSLQTGANESGRSED